MTLTAEQVMAQALHRIAAMRDGLAVGGVDLPEEYEAFEDWAAAVAEKALDEAGYYNSWHTKDKTEGES